MALKSAEMAGIAALVLLLPGALRVISYFLLMPMVSRVHKPIHLAATYVQPGAGEWGAFDYSRSGNPTRKALETTLASLESGAGALAFASGMAATHCVCD